MFIYSLYQSDDLTHNKSGIHCQSAKIEMAINEIYECWLGASEIARVTNTMHCIYNYEIYTKFICNFSMFSSCFYGFSSPIFFRWIFLLPVPRPYQIHT